MSHREAQRLVPLIEVWDWQHHALCRGYDTAWFYPEGSRREQARRVVQAKAVCTRCPVAAVCREHALATREPYGIWGGLTAAEREQFTGPATPCRPSTLRGPGLRP